ncbi:RNA-dependent DNA polymerase [Lewinellaceae bacterium SD302]|nr:RNA-dependent DNA polymerase [Lewinellaceae bacterium SD302]
MAFLRSLFINEAKKKGRSEEFLKTTLEYADFLDGKGLPVIFSPLHFSLLVQTDYHYLKHLISVRSDFYANYYIRKRRGGKRKISVPFVPLRIVQKYINDFILNKVDVHPKAFAFVRNKSIVDNAKVHVNQEWILNIDIKDFFTSIGVDKVYTTFRSLGYVDNLCYDFAKLCTAKLEAKSKREFLPQGAPTSPNLSNIIMRNVDRRFENFSIKNDICYSRYADDITFSGKKSKLPKISFLRKVFKEEGFQLNEKKTQYYGPNSNRRFVTGLIVKDDVKIPNRFINSTSRQIYMCEKHGVDNHIDWLKKNHGITGNYYYEWLMGKIAFINMVEPSEAKFLYDRVNRIDWGLK